MQCISSGRKNSVPKSTGDDLFSILREQGITLGSSVRRQCSGDIGIILTDENEF